MPVDMEDWFMVLRLREETKLNNELCRCCLILCIFAKKDPILPLCGDSQLFIRDTELLKVKRLLQCGSGSQRIH